MKLVVAALITAALQTAVFPQAAPKLSLKLEREPTEDASGQTVWLTVRITNISQQNVDVLMSSNHELQYTFSVIGPDGRPAPPTKDAEKLRRTPRGSGSQQLFTLKPGQSASWGVHPLSDLVDFSKPGTYRITATRHFGAPIDETDSSNVLEVNVP